MMISISKWMCISLMVMATAISVYSETYYVSPSGDDATNSGTQSSPFRTIQKAANVAHAGRVTVKNNIFFGNTGGGGTPGQIELGAKETVKKGLVIDNNLYCTMDGGSGPNGLMGNIPAEANGPNRATLTFSQWLSALNTNRATGINGSADSHSLTADPLFVNASEGDFHLQANSPARGAGTGGVDMGAYPIAGTAPTLR